MGGAVIVCRAERQDKGQANVAKKRNAESVNTTARQWSESDAESAHTQQQINIQQRYIDQWNDHRRI